MTATIADRFADLVAGTEPRDVPAPAHEAAAVHALDTLGCALAAYGLGKASFVGEAYAARGVSGLATVIGSPDGLPADMAAMVNGVLNHALDFDDTHAGSIVHVSAATVPAALAAGQEHGRNGRDVLHAIVLGNEVSVRVGRAAGGGFHARGFHPTGVCGIFGAVAAVARLMGASVPQTRNALGIAGSMAGGLLEFLADGSETKPVHPGWAAHAALNAVSFAVHGATGPRTVFEGTRGFFATYLHGELADLAGITDGLGHTWLTEEIAFKPYPACHYVHAPLDALTAIVREHGLAADDIESITAYSNDTGIGLVLEPLEDKRTPRTAYDAKFSIPYAFGALMVHGHVGVETFTDEAITDRDVLAVAARVGYERRVYSERPDSFGGGVRVRTTDGRTFEHELRYQRGGPDNPMSEQDVVDKYRANASVALEARQVDELEKYILNLDSAANLDPLWVLSHAQDKKA